MERGEVIDFNFVIAQSKFFVLFHKQQTLRGETQRRFDSLRRCRQIHGDDDAITGSNLSRDVARAFCEIRRSFACELTRLR